MGTRQKLPGVSSTPGRTTVLSFFGRTRGRAPRVCPTAGTHPLSLCCASVGTSAMDRLLGIVHMNPEVDPSTWDHTEASMNVCLLFWCSRNHLTIIVVCVSLSRFCGTQEDIYGLGGVRTPEKFYDTFGIDVFNKKTEGHLCRFVDRGGMHRQFTKFLRSDGMGIDYDRITYRFKDPAPNEK